MHPKKDDTKIKIDFEVKNMENLYLAKNTDYDIVRKKYEKCKKQNDDLLEDNNKLKEEIKHQIQQNKKLTTKILDLNLKMKNNFIFEKIR